MPPFTNLIGISDALWNTVYPPAHTAPIHSEVNVSIAGVITRSPHHSGQ